MSAGSVVVITVFALAAGLVAGALLWRTFGPQNQP